MSGLEERLYMRSASSPARPSAAAAISFVVKCAVTSRTPLPRCRAASRCSRPASTGLCARRPFGRNHSAAVSNRLCSNEAKCARAKRRCSATASSGRQSRKFTAVVRRSRRASSHPKVPSACAKRRCHAHGTQAKTPMRPMANHTGQCRGPRNCRKGGMGTPQARSFSVALGVGRGVGSLAFIRAASIDEVQADVPGGGIPGNN